jgi:hypothetical protein
MSAPSPFGPLVAQLTGTAPNLQPIPADHGAELQHVVALLRAFPDDAAARWMADGFDAWLKGGGDLQAALGLRPRRGGAHDLPHRRGPRSDRDRRLRELAAALADSDRAAALAGLIRSRDPRTLVIHQETGAPLPTSRAQLARILRDTDPA